MLDDMLSKKKSAKGNSFNSLDTSEIPYFLHSTDKLPGYIWAELSKVRQVLLDLGGNGVNFEILNMWNQI
jgi:hypothetical protein